MKKPKEVKLQIAIQEAYHVTHHIEELFKTKTGSSKRSGCVGQESSGTLQQVWQGQHHCPSTYLYLANITVPPTTSIQLQSLTRDM